MTTTTTTTTEINPLITAQKTYSQEVCQKTIGYSTTKYNTDGLLTEVSSSYSNITFEYTSQSNVKMSVNDLEYPKDSYTVKFEIGSNGFATKALQTYSDNTTDTWEFGYNSDGQLNNMKRSEGGNEITVITYENGNITGIKMQSNDVTEGILTTKIDYASQTYPKGIENKGCIMLFDITFGIDMDEMGVAYYAGLLGHPTKNLPLKKQNLTLAKPQVRHTHSIGLSMRKAIQPNSVQDNDDIYFAW